MIPSKDTVFLHLANGYLIYAIISLLVLPIGDPFYRFKGDYTSSLWPFLCPVDGFL